MACMPKNRSLKDYVGIALRGFCMGIADIVPGVSGGTMAFILGIYEELIDSIKSLTDTQTWKDIFQGKWKEALEETDMKFLCALAVGILIAVLLLSHTIEYVLEEYPLFVWSFFFGLVLASVHAVYRRVNKWNGMSWMSLVIGVVIAYTVVGIVPVQTPEAWWFLVLSGAIAICAMILPGISGSFLLVLLGKYEFVLSAVNNRDFANIGFVGLGTVTGILLFSRFLSWLLHHYHDRTIAFLIGLMIGSLRKIWPWKLSEAVGEQINIFPPLTVQGALNGEVIAGIALMAAGFVMVMVLETIANHK